MKFYKVYIEISDLCNLNCSFCTHKKHVRGAMSLELFSKILKSLKNKTRYLSLHVLGDPLFLDNLDEYLYIAREFRLDIVTNGFYLNKHDYRILTTKNIHQISFSLDSYFDSANALNIPNDYFERLFSFCEFKKKYAKDMFINFRIFKDIAKAKLALKKHFSFEESSSSLDSIRLDSKILLRVHKYFSWKPKSIRSVESIKLVEEAKEEVKRPNKKAIFCHGGINQLAFLSDGRITPCCYDANCEILLGDVSKSIINKKDSINEFFYKDKFKSFKERNIANLAPSKKCIACSFRGLV